MQNISYATEKLIEQIKMLCPNCTTPGWSVKRYEGFARCHYCYTETTYPLYEVMGCQSCLYEEKVLIDQTTFPLDSCSMCNP